MSFVGALRIGELILARRNGQWLLRQNAVEYGREHYPYMVTLHTLFFVSLVVEYYVRGTPQFSTVLLGVYFLLLLFKGWTIRSLGKYWNTRIYRVPEAPLVTRGPYRYLKHPNYLIVIAEIAVIPLVFHLYYTAVIFSLLNAVMLTVRIRTENRALSL